MTGALRVLRAADVLAVMEGREEAVIDAVRRAYLAHEAGATSMPPDGYLRFPGRERERIIAKVAHLGADVGAAGIKWIASFPDNVAAGLERASATMVLNDLDTGHPLALLEASIISAARTAASAALAAQVLGRHTDPRLGVVGAGLISYETVRHLRLTQPHLADVVVADLDPDRATAWCTRVQQATGLSARPAPVTEVLASPTLLLATTAVTPHVTALPDGEVPQLVLHISLRDLAADVVLTADNVVDDIDKAVSNATSLHLAEQQVGHRDFVRATLGHLLPTGGATDEPGHVERDTHAPTRTIFSPFGLGILDVAVGQMVLDTATATGAGTLIEDFLPTPWHARP